MRSAAVGGSPQGTISDLTLFSACGIRARIEDIQPPNDPFILDNIFKSPRRRRRGLLSWSAMPMVDQALQGGKAHVVPAAWDLSRHMRARSQRRSILGNRTNFPSICRRRPKARNSGINQLGMMEHARSKSDPTLAITIKSPPPALPSRISRASSTSLVSIESSSTEGMEYDGSSVESSPRSLPSSTATIPEQPTVVRKRLPRPDYTKAVEYRGSDGFTHVAVIPQHQESLTLSGVPGHPMQRTRKSRQPVKPVSGLFPDVKIQRPAPVLLRAVDNRVRSQRCSSVPGAPASVAAMGALLPPCLVRSASQAFGGTQLAGSKADVAGPVSGPENTGDASLRIPPDGHQMLSRPSNTRASVDEDVRRAAAGDTGDDGDYGSFDEDDDEPSEMSITGPSAENGASLASDDGSSWLLPAAVRLLRRMVLCGPNRRR
ncbi:hypothetical protein GGI07_002446 [Coemansia sp. Benny D115]|nr:hypothetical protein GGI07_002446 [Coemansia sp. Benny D115]